MLLHRAGSTSFALLGVIGVAANQSYDPFHTEDREQHDWFYEFPLASTNV